MKKIISAAVIILALILVSSSVIITHENEYKLVRQFGKINRVIYESGLSLKVPFLQNIDTIPKEILLYDLPESDVITKDKKAMVADSYVLWRVTDPMKFAQSLSFSVSNAEMRIDTVVYNALKTYVGGQTQDQVISNRENSLNIEMLSAVAKPMEEYGIKILSVETKRIDLPADNKAAVFNRMISERSQIAAGYTAEGEEESQKVKNATDREITVSLSEARAEAEMLIAEGESEYMRILSEAYGTEERADFYEFIRNLDAVKISLKGENKTLILPVDSPLTKILLGR